MPALLRKKNVYKNTRKLRINKISLYKIISFIKPYKIKAI
jgi:hypothetical protein